MAELNSKAKYIRLAPGNAFWKADSKTVDFTLTTLRKDGYYAETSSIPEEIYANINKSVEGGLLEFTKSLKTPSKHKFNEGKPLVQTDRTSLKWKDENRELSGKALKTPSFTAYNMEISEDDPVYKSAFKILSLPNSNAVTSEVSKVLSTLDDKEDKKKFLGACYKIESDGKNPTLHPRGNVNEFLSDALFDLGVGSGISPITTDENDDTIVEDVKPVKFNL